MKTYFILRNKQRFGPYTVQVLKQYVEDGKIIKSDTALENGFTHKTTVRHILKNEKIKVNVKHQSGFSEQIKSVGKSLIIPQNTFSKSDILSDKRMLVLAIIGLFPVLLMFVLGGFPQFWVFYLTSLYFSVIWGLFFYYLFKTEQIKLKTTIALFFTTQIFVFVVWDVFGIVALNPFYHLTDSNNVVLKLVGYIFGVGFMEELAKCLPLFILLKRAKEPYIPQSIVFYGLMSGIAFGVFEGVQYQLSVNSNLEYTQSFFMNIARLTSLPFLHAIWCGVAGYFISFSALYPKYRVSLIFLAIAIPATLHGIYDTFCSSLIGFFIALPITIIGVILLMKYLKQGSSNQTILSN